MTLESVKPEAPEAPQLRNPPLAGGGIPGLGHGWKLARDPLGFLAQLRDHGDIVRLKLGPKTMYAVTTPALTGELALSPDYEIGGPLWESLEGLLGKHGVATANGPTHRRQRRTIQPAFRLDIIPSTGRSWRRRRGRSRRAGSRGRSSTAHRSRSGSPCASRPVVCCAAITWTSGRSG
ncbi:hypothetical protein SAV31267_064560 [Streptomyces avermitilis]|uniref:Cytochrome P450 n=1 Tax=Streptomyces avermitilis TaxID=33903 RepID=A0A4D4MXR3_STRAX|nr:hypothetical protein SAV31267_064560 [Streptomyces avermitilis]